MGRGQGNQRSAATNMLRGPTPQAEEEFPGFEFAPSQAPRYSLVAVSDAGAQSNIELRPRKEWPDFRSVTIEFSEALDKHEREQISGAVAYWASLGHVSNGSTENRWLSNKTIWIDASSYGSRSPAWRMKRDIFALLDEFLVEGSPVRKTKENTRLWEGVGQSANRVFLLPSSRPFNPPVDPSSIKPARINHEYFDGRERAQSSGPMTLDDLFG